MTKTAVELAADEQHQNDQGVYNEWFINGSNQSTDAEPSEIGFLPRWEDIKGQANDKAQEVVKKFKDSGNSNTKQFVQDLYKADPTFFIKYLESRKNKDGGLFTPEQSDHFLQFFGCIENKQQGGGLLDGLVAGRTAHPLDSIKDDLHGGIDPLGDVEKFWNGHSWGGRLAVGLPIIGVALEALNTLKDKGSQRFWDMAWVGIFAGIAFVTSGMANGISIGAKAQSPTSLVESSGLPLHGHGPAV